MISTTYAAWRAVKAASRRIYFALLRADTFTIARYDGKFACKMVTSGGECGEIAGKFALGYDRREIAAGSARTWYSVSSSFIASS